MPTYTVQCSPDADDLFMMRALTNGAIDTGDRSYVVDTSPTDELNTLASGGGPDVCAISTAHYPLVADVYQMLPHGGSMGEGYGPVLVSPTPRTLESFEGKKVAIPGTSTSAWATMKMLVSVDPVVVPIAPYELTFEVLRSGTVEAALLIHEGRLTYPAEGFHKVIDLGEWWDETTGGLPLPLGGNTIKRSLGDDVIALVSDDLRRSIQHAIDNREDSIRWLLSQSSALTTRDEVSEYLDMYANGRTLDYGDAGRAGIFEFLKRLGFTDTIDYAP